MEFRRRMPAAIVGFGTLVGCSSTVSGSNESGALDGAGLATSGGASGVGASGASGGSGGSSGGSGTSNGSGGSAGRGAASGGSANTGASTSLGGGGMTEGPDAGTSGDASGATDSGMGGAGGGGTTARPGYNTGSGFFTLNGKLYDANGAEFHVEGIDTTHYDQNWASCTSDCGIPNSHANVNRIGMPLWSSISDQTIQNLMNEMIGQHIVPIPGVWYVDGSYSSASNVTCQENSGAGSTFDTAVSQWVARAGLFKAFEKYMLLNIANEWGPSDSTAWRDAYVDAIGKLRGAGYLCTLVVDAGGCGQDVNDIVKYAQAISDADPQHNVVFDQHVYGQWATADTGEQSYQTDLPKGFDQLRASGLTILIGEFGPGRNVGPSPTLVTPGTIIQAANAHGFGWMAWAWDDGYGNGDNGFELSNRGAFSLTNGAPTNGGYPNNTDLSKFGNDVVLNPTYGTFGTARPATVF